MTRRRIELTESKVVSTTIIAPEVLVIEFERKGIPFKAGQVVAIALNKEMDPRLYTIVSGEEEDHFKILFDIYPNGFVTPLLAKLKKGDTLLVSEPFGKFIDNSNEAVWIATGTGIAPFISMTLSGQYKNKMLLHGSRTLNNFFYERLFTDKLNSQYLRFCTTEKSDHSIHGRLTTWLKNAELQTNIKYYLCGSSQMVVEVRDILVAKGIPFANIIAEIYF